MPLRYETALLLNALLATLQSELWELNLREPPLGDFDYLGARTSRVLSQPDRRRRA